MKIAVHQPNFIPWIGFFNKIFLSDHFVILDDVKPPQTGGGNWLNRNFLNLGGRKKLFTIPIKQIPGGYKIISDIEISDNESWQKKLIQAVAFNYKKTEFYKEGMNVIENICTLDELNLASLNVAIINQICEFLEINRKKIVLASDFGVMSSSTLRIRDLIECLGGSTYVCGEGSDAYLKADVLVDSGIQVCYQENSYPRYKQPHTSDFIENLSIIDWIFNQGRIKTIQAIESSKFVKK